MKRAARIDSNQLTAAEYSLMKKKKGSKFKNVKVETDGIKFDSKKEQDHYLFLKDEEAAGNIKELNCQVRFRLKISEQLICAYVADFVFHHKDSSGKWITQVEDVKSEFTRKNPVYRIKKKLMKAIYGIDIVEI